MKISLIIDLGFKDQGSGAQGPLACTFSDCCRSRTHYRRAFAIASTAARFCTSTENIFLLVVVYLSLPAQVTDWPKNTCLRNDL